MYAGIMGEPITFVRPQSSKKGQNDSQLCAAAEQFENRKQSTSVNACFL